MRSSSTDLQDSDSSSLKHQYLVSLGSLSAGMRSLRQLVIELVRRGFRRETLLRWAVEAGHNEHYIRSLLSKLLAGSGSRKRKPGAGPKTSLEAIELLDSVCQKHGLQRARKLLRAALHAADGRVEAQHTPQKVHHSQTDAACLLILVEDKQVNAGTGSRILPQTVPFVTQTPGPVPVAL